MPPSLVDTSARSKVPVFESTLRLITCDHIVAGIGVMKEKYSCILIRSPPGQRIAETHEN